MEQETRGADLRMRLRALRRRWWVIIGCVAVVAATAVAVSEGQQKEYSATATLLFRDPGFSQTLFGSVNTPVQDPARQAATNVQLVSLGNVAVVTGRRLGIGSDRVSREVAVSSKGQSDLVSVAATDASPQLAASIANTFARDYIDTRRQSDRQKIDQARRVIDLQLARLTPSERSGKRGQALRDQSNQLDTLGSIQTGNAEVVQSATPPHSPSSPRPTRNGILGGGLGLMLGLFLAFGLDRMDRRIRDPSEVEQIFERPVLAGVLKSSDFEKSTSPVDALRAVDGEAFRMLWANLRYFNVNREIRSVLVTSAAPGEGKSTVAWYLTAASAETGARALLIEVDLRRPTLDQRLGRQTGRGLTTVLAGDARLEDVIEHVPVQTRQNGASPKAMDVVLAGPVPPNPADLLDSDAMRAVLSQAEDTYDLVVIDTPPLSAVSDVVPLIGEVSGVIVVSRIDKSLRDAATRLSAQLTRLDAPTLGVVVNATSGSGQSYGYGYGYD